MPTSVIRQYLCLHCDHTVTPTPLPHTSRLNCPNCNSTYLERLQNPNPTGNSANFIAPLDNHAHLLPEHLLDSDESRRLAAFLQDYPSMLPDDYDEPGFDDMIAEFFGYGHGTPAAETVVEALPSVIISAAMVGAGLNICAACKESFCVGDVAKELLCKHVYHCECILPWLHMHNSCPLCRFELPTEDVEYENRRRDGMDTSVGGFQENVESSRGVRRLEEGSHSSTGGNGNAGGSM